MNIKNIKKGKQNKYVNSVVKKHDEECINGENLLGESLDSIDFNKKSYLIQLGNLREERKKFRQSHDAA